MTLGDSSRAAPCAAPSGRHTMTPLLYPSSAIFSTGDADLFLPWQNDATALRANPHPAVMASTLCVGAIFSSDNAILSLP